MPAYHSAYNHDNASQVIGNMALLPFATAIRGPAPPFYPEVEGQEDIIDEAISLFRANSLFRNFEIQGAADRTLIYLILFIGDCLTKISRQPSWTVNDAYKHLPTSAVEAFALPGEPTFPLNSMYAAPASRLDADALRAYLTQARQETVTRLLLRVYPENQPKPSKWWMAFQKRKFMGKSLGVH